MFIKISGTAGDKLVRSFDNLRVNKVADLQTVLLKLYSRISDYDGGTIVIPDICDILTWFLESGLSLADSINKLNETLINLHGFASKYKTFVVCNSHYYDTPNLYSNGHVEVKFHVSQSSSALTQEVSKFILEKQTIVTPYLNKLHELDNFIYACDIFEDCDKRARKLEEQLSNGTTSDVGLFNVSGKKLLQILHNEQEIIVKYKERFDKLTLDFESKNSELDRVNQELNIYREKCRQFERKDCDTRNKLLQRTVLNLQDDIAVKLDSISSYEKNMKSLNERVSTLKEKNLEEKSVTEWLRASIKKFNSQRWSKSRAFRKKTKKSEELLLKTGMFDTNFYVTKYPDVKESSLSPCCHYLLFGAYEGRIPNPKFHPTNYLQANCDVVADGIEPLLHYSIFGVHEQRKKNKY